MIKHKRVTKELKRAKKFRQAKSRAGLKGASKRWHGQSTAITKERKRNVIEREDKDSSYSNTADNSSSFTTPLRTRPDKDSHVRALYFSESLAGIIKPRNQSDRTCFKNITNWLMTGCTTGRFNNEIFKRVLDYAKEVTYCRNPAAAFVSLLKKELDYRPNAVKAGQL